METISLREVLTEGTVYGILSASLAYLIIQYGGLNPQTIPLLLYLYVISGILINLKAEVERLSLPYLKKLVIVEEGENIKFTKLFTREKYKVRGDVEKL